MISDPTIIPTSVNLDNNIKSVDIISQKGVNEVWIDEDGVEHRILEVDRETLDNVIYLDNKGLLPDNVELPSHREAADRIMESNRKRTNTLKLITFLLILLPISYYYLYDDIIQLLEEYGYIENAPLIIDLKLDDKISLIDLEEELSSPSVLDYFKSPSSSVESIKLNIYLKI